MSLISKMSKLISLLALALGLMAFGAGAAQAETGAFWEVNGVPLTGSAEVQAKNDTAHTTILSKVGTSPIEILCGPVKFVGATLSGTGFKGKLYYEECTTKLNGAAASSCTPKTSGTSLGSIETNALKGLLELHEPSPVDLLELLPETGIPLAELQLGSLCAVGNNFDITGKLFLKDSQTELLVNKEEHLFEEGPLSALLFGGNAMTIDGSFWMFLIGMHEGQSFSGHPTTGVETTEEGEEAGAFWEVNGAKLTGSASVQLKNDTVHTTFLSKFGTSTVEILCGPVKFVSGTLSGTGLTGRLHYEECTTKVNGTAANRCTPKSPGASLGLIETNALKGFLKLTSSKKDVLELVPAGGTAFVTWELGSLCAIGNKFDIVGKYTLKDCQGEERVNKLEHLFEEGPASALFFGGNAITVDGSFWMFLTGADLGQTFSGHPV